MKADFEYKGDAIGEKFYRELDEAMDNDRNLNWLKLDSDRDKFKCPSIGHKIIVRVSSDTLLTTQVPQERPKAPFVQLWTKKAKF